MKQNIYYIIPADELPRQKYKDFISWLTKINTR